MPHLFGGHANDMREHANQPLGQDIVSFRLGCQPVGEPAEGIDGLCKRHGLGISSERLDPPTDLVAVPP